MKILMLHKTRKGGVAIYVEHVKKELEKLGHKVDEITRNEDLGFSSFISSIGALKKTGIKESGNYDVIHAHDWSIAFPLLGKVKNMVVTFHAFPTNPIAAVFQNYTISRLGKRAIVISPGMKQRYRSATFISNGVDLDVFKRKKTKKRQGMLVGISQKYSEDQIRKACANAGLEVISTEGKLKFEELPKFYSGLDIYISIPYKQAGFNMVWTENMACEVPYIIGTEAGIGEILPIYKISKMSELEPLLKSIKERKVPPLKGSRKWLQEHDMTWKAAAGKMASLYESIKN